MTYSDSNEQMYGLSQSQQIAFLEYCWQLDSLGLDFLEQYFLCFLEDAWIIDGRATGEAVEPFLEPLDEALDETLDEALYEIIYETLYDSLLQNLGPDLIQLDETRNSHSQVRGQLRCTNSGLWMPIDWFYT